MITAVDSSVLWAIFNEEKTANQWTETLAYAASEGTLVVSPVAFAEMAHAENDVTSLINRLARFSITYDKMSPESAYLGGLIFKRYRKAGGPRNNMIPDFIIAAHAMVQADRLAAIDRGYLRTWFSDLNLLQPS